jgi:hypothetical protein
MIALRTFDEKPCVSNVSVEAFGYSLRRIRPLFRPAPGYPRTRQNTRRLRLSFSLNDVNQQQGLNPNPTKPQGAKTARQPSQVTRNSRHSVSLLSQQGPPRRSAASLSDPAYRGRAAEVSTPDFRNSKEKA